VTLVLVVAVVVMRRFYVVAVGLVVVFAVFVEVSGQWYIMLKCLGLWQLVSKCLACKFRKFKQTSRNRRVGCKCFRASAQRRCVLFLLSINNRTCH
jgi:hypothetical protein